MAGAGAGETVVVGRILGAWGVQGWVQVYSWTDPPEALFEYQPWYLGNLNQSTFLSDWRRSGQKLLVSFPGIDSPEAASALTQIPILVSRAQLPEPPAGQYYWHDLIDLEVVNLQGHRWGTITKILPTGAHDVMQILGEDERTILIPFVADRFVLSVDLGAGRVLVDWPADWEA